MKLLEVLTGQKLVSSLTHFHCSKNSALQMLGCLTELLTLEEKEDVVIVITVHQCFRIKFGTTEKLVPFEDWLANQGG